MSALFEPLTLRGVTIKNRIAVSPMSQYRAVNGYANSWHMVHLGRFALGGAGLVYAEATAVEARGRRTHGDLGLWEDGQIEPLVSIVEFIEAEGAVPGIQLGHAGRKASECRPWHGETPVDSEDEAVRDEAPWPPIAPSPLPYADGWPVPAEMGEVDIVGVIDTFGQAARRAADAAGGAVDHVDALRGQRPGRLDGVFRLDSSSGPVRGREPEAEGQFPRPFSADGPCDFNGEPPASRGIASPVIGAPVGQRREELVNEESVTGVNLEHAESGIGGTERPPRMPIAEGFQMPFAERMRCEAGVASIAVGFLWDPAYCEAVIADGRADMVALARELLDDPNWPLHAAAQLGADTGHQMWPPEMGWWLMKRDRVGTKLGLR